MFSLQFLQNWDASLDQICVDTMCEQLPCWDDKMTNANYRRHRQVPTEQDLSMSRPFPRSETNYTIETLDNGQIGSVVVTWSCVRMWSCQLISERLPSGVIPQSQVTSFTCHLAGTWSDLDTYLIILDISRNRNYNEDIKGNSPPIRFYDGVLLFTSS